MAKLPLYPNQQCAMAVQRFKALPDAENYYRQHLSKLSRSLMQQDGLMLYAPFMATATIA